MAVLRGAANVVSKYLSVLDVTSLYVITSDGLPLLFYGVSEDVGEELGGAGEGIIKSRLLSRLCDNADTLVIVGSRDVVVHKIDGSTYVTAVVARGTGYSVASSLTSNAPKCGKCGNSLKYTVITCPNCGKKLPFTTTVCPFCGEVIRFRRCPACSAVIDSSGRPARVLERLASGSVASSFSFTEQGKGEGGESM